MEEITIKITNFQLSTLRNIVKERIKDVIEELDSLTVFNPEHSIKGCELENLAVLNNKLTDAFIASLSQQNEEDSNAEKEQQEDCRTKLTLLSHLGIEAGEEIRYDNGDTFIVENPNVRACVKHEGKCVSLNYLIKNVYKAGGGHSYAHFWYQGRKLSDISDEIKKRILKEER